MLRRCRKQSSKRNESRWTSAGPYDVASSHNCVATQRGNTHDSGHCHCRVNCRYPYVVMGACVPPVYGRENLGNLETLTRRLLPARLILSAATLRASAPGSLSRECQCFEARPASSASFWTWSPTYPCLSSWEPAPRLATCDSSGQFPVNLDLEVAKCSLPTFYLPRVMVVSRCTRRTISSSPQRKLAEHRIGALVVENQWMKRVGIFSERDLVNGIAHKGSAVLGFRVQQLMSSPIISCHSSG